MRKKIFAVSDIHGHATLLKEALSNAGFQESNPEHLLVVCGDCFDRGKENRAVYLYLDRIKNKVIIRGNHEDILEDTIYKAKVTDHARDNGTEKTVKEFFGSDYDYERCTLFIDERTNGYKELIPFLQSTRDYFETEKYVFTHGWLPLINQGTFYVDIPDNWRYATPAEWRKARWTEWHKVYPYRPILKDKTLIVGHRSTAYGSMFDPKRQSKCHDPFHGEGMIAIDALTVLSEKINVITLTDNVPDAVTHQMSLQDRHFRKMKAREKTVEMRLPNEKRKQIHTGDQIEFTNTETEEKLTVTVTSLHRFPTFRELISAMSAKALGFEGQDAAEILKAIVEIYPEDKQKRFGALAIKVQIDQARV